MEGRPHRRPFAARPGAAAARLLAAALWCCAPVAALAAEAGEAPPGASACTGCHVPAMRATSIPPIHGQPAAELAAALRGFRSGERHATVMDRIAKGFTVEELDALAAFFARPAP